MDNVNRLDASLYVPGIHPDLAKVLQGEHPAAPQSIIVCTEDAISESDVDFALDRLHSIVRHLPSRSDGPLRFIRPRSPSVLRQLLRMPGIERVHGFVIPKSDGDTLPAYLRILGRRTFHLMPILETAAVFEREGIQEIRHFLQHASVKARILALRIGGNDLLRLLGLKRFPGHTIYETPIGALIPLLIMAFKPYGFRLTGVACDEYANPDLLRIEARRDRLMGLVGKTAVHPCQVPVIQQEFRPSSSDLEAARSIIAEASGGAFGLNGVMLEPAVHLAWATDVVDAAQAKRGFGVTDSEVYPRLQNTGAP
jgi:citrate lyase beta subunit